LGCAKGEIRESKYSGKKVEKGEGKEEERRREWVNFL